MAKHDKKPLDKKCEVTIELNLYILKIKWTIKWEA